MVERGCPSTFPRIAVAGVSGFAGAEFVRLLLSHPRFAAERLLLLGRPDERATTSLSDLHPQLASVAQGDPLIFPLAWDRRSDFGADVLVLATPHEQSREWVPHALTLGLRVIDLSGAWRLKKKANREIYKLKDLDEDIAAGIQEEAVYGAPELHRPAIATARLIANPGCYATSVILALAPLLHAGIVDLDRGIISDSKSGVSGAGKAATARTHFMYAADNLSAYAVFGHRHTGELLEQLSLHPDQIQFTPHLLPIPRGILSTIYLRLKEAASAAALESCFRDFYVQSPLVRIRTAGSLPEIQHVVRTNFCDIGFALGPDARSVVVISCLDNLLKGAAGQAVQNLNLMLGWGETEGLI